MHFPCNFTVDNISTHSLTRRLTSHMVKAFIIYGISTHSLTRRLTALFNSCRKAFHISTHSLTRRLTTVLQIFQIQRCYFNSQPHKEADEGHEEFRKINCISTHSLTRRLTWDWSSDPEADRISTHSLTRRLTAWSTAVAASVAYFNSQPHKEADGSFQFLSQGLSYFNSQPHKEADGCAASQKIFQGYFNSQPHKEADLDKLELTTKETIFQLTASQGGWQQLSTCKNYIDSISTHSLTRRLTRHRRRTRDWERHFNSQPHKEADLRCKWTVCVNFISTHSLTRRLTFPCSCPRMFEIFQLTASQGGWQYDTSTSPTGVKLFQLTASQGGWRLRLRNQRSSLVFQLTASQGGWRGSRTEFMKIFGKFQLTASQGGWPREVGQFHLSIPFQLTASQGGWQFLCIF